ncbi:MAG TPA: hypothetical protein ENO27_02730 [Caldithrix sp.]|nr:hypothetical protein [Caldithrix sp.]
MRLALSIFLFAHGIAHLVGFLVPWRFVKTEDMPYKTTLLMGKIDIGDIGIRIIGIIWLLIALAYFYAGWITFQQTDYWINYTLVVTIISLIFCIAAIPDSHIGIYINIALIVLYYLNNHYSWLN